jgi:hypothetical protein
VLGRVVAAAATDVNGGMDVALADSDVARAIIA